MAMRKKRSWSLYYLWGGIALLLALILDARLITFITTLRIVVLDTLFVLTAEVLTKMVIVIIATVLLLVKAKKLVWRLLASSFVSLVFVYVLKTVIARVRPFFVLKIPVLVEATNYSFPSGHTTVAFATLPYVFSAYKQSSVKWVWLAVVLLIAYSRLYLGVHYLSDVIAGALLGFFIGEVFLKMK